MKDLSQLAEPVLGDNTMETLRSRYLWKDEANRVVETPAQLFWRVAGAIAQVEARHGATAGEIESLAVEFCNAMARGELLPNSPTLMNAGRREGMLSACFVLPIDDSVDRIFDSVKQTAQIQKLGGGTGFSFDRLRPAGDYIATSGGRTSGPISFWRVFCEATRAIQQGAFRRGANMGMMSVWHPDILKFITAKNDLGEFENFNVSVKVTDEFMRRLRESPTAPHVVVNPRTGRRYFLPLGLDIRGYFLGDLLPADDAEAASAPADAVYTVRQIWELIIRSAHATGEPGLCFIDRVNADNPTPALGKIEATNPCGEQPLLDYEACNLASVDVSKFVRDGHLDEPELRAKFRLGVRLLDDVIDANNYVVPEIESRCRGNRKIGLGIMGLADAMFELGIRYDSDAGLDFGRSVARLLAGSALAASEDLARRRGSFPNWKGSRWDVRGGRPMRNAAVTCVAPTGTLSILAGCSGGIEPAFSLVFARRVLEGRRLVEVNGPFRRYAERRGFWSADLASRLAGGETLETIGGIDPAAVEVFRTAHQIAPSWHVRMQAAFQEHIDGAISKTINLPAEADQAAVEEVYNLAYDLKCKGVTIYRDGSRGGQPMATGGGGVVCPGCHATIDDQAACSRCPRCGMTICA